MESGKPFYKDGGAVKKRYNNFMPGEPNENGEEDCLAFNGWYKDPSTQNLIEGLWNDYSCYHHDVGFFFVEFDDK